MLARSIESQLGKVRFLDFWYIAKVESKDAERATKHIYNVEVRGRYRIDGLVVLQRRPIGKLKVKDA
jgi:hypothetical protein